jgi:cyclic pyranopterin phosphate synthase
MEWIPYNDILTFEEIVKIVNTLAKHGITKIKITGGEALIRKGIIDLIKMLRQIHGIQQLTLTTNGLLLEQYLQELISAGISALNISINTLNKDTFFRLTHSEDFSAMENLIKIIPAIPIPVKINCVPILGINDCEILQIAALAKKCTAVRFIELMPMDCAEKYQPVNPANIKNQIEDAFGKLVPCNKILGNGPAKYFSLKNFDGKIGFISAMSECFCKSCSRLRLNSEGFLQNCLFDKEKFDLKSIIRENSKQINKKLSEIIKKAVGCKPKTYESHFIKPESQKNQMYKIGG